MSERPSQWANLRDGFAAAREIIIVGAVLALILAPTVVRSILEDAGIRAVAGIEFDIDSLSEAQDEMSVAEAQILQLTQELESARQMIEQSRNRSGQLSPEMNVVSQQLKKIGTLGEAARSHVHSAGKGMQGFAQEIKLKPMDDLLKKQSNRARPNARLGASLGNDTDVR